MLYHISFNDVCEYKLILNFMPVTHFKEVGLGAAEDRCGSFGNARKHSTGKEVHWLRLIGS